jgi:alkylated DNA repair dioxygenase AlkB
VFDRDYADTIAAAESTPAPTATWQGTLFGVAEPRVDPTAVVARTALDDACWLDRADGWLGGADDVFASLHDRVEWRCPVVNMYERRLPQPRLSAWFRFGRDELPTLPVLHQMRTSLSEHYDVDFDSMGLNLYRDGTDSVAWHGDRHAKVQRDPIVAIVTVGSARPFLLRPKGGGRSRRLVPHPGDLVVMGGSCQHRWEHCVPKVHHAGPRLSITFRHSA